MNALAPYIWQLFWAWFLQVLLFRHGVLWGGTGLFVVHLYGLMNMPSGWPPTAYLLVAAFMGASLDILCLTGGMHLAAAATLGMAYPSLMAAVEPRDGFRPGHAINPHEDGWMSYLMLAASSTTLYLLVLFGLQHGWTLMGRTLVQTLASVALNLVVFMLFQGLLNRPTRHKGSGPNAYPWS
jgi:hypothetical protein